MTTSNSKQFLVDITEHFIEINDRSHHFNTVAHVIKDTEHYKAGNTVLVAVNGRFDCVSIKSRNGSWTELEFADPIYYSGLEYYDYWRG